MAEQYKVLVGKVLTGEQRLSRFVLDSKFEKRMRLINASTKDIWVCNSDGSIIRLKPSIKHHLHNSLIIAYETFPHDNEVDWIEGLEDPNLQQLSMEFKENGRTSWDEEISMEDINAHCEGVYIKMADVVITSSYIYAQKLHHPKCIQKMHNDYISAKTVIDATKMINVSIRMVDNNSRYSTMYTVFHNQVLTLKSMIEPGMKDGIYVTGFNTVNEHGNRTTRMDTHYSFEDVDAGKAPVKLFFNYSEADASRDFLSIKEIESIEKNMAREHELSVLQLKRQLEESDLISKQRERELSEIKSRREDEYHSAKHYRNLESERYALSVAETKSHYDRQSTNNKSFSEGIKTIGLVVTGVLALKAILG